MAQPNTRKTSRKNEKIHARLDKQSTCSLNLTPETNSTLDVTQV